MTDRDLADHIDAMRFLLLHPTPLIEHLSRTWKAGQNPEEIVRGFLQLAVLYTAMLRGYGWEPGQDLADVGFEEQSTVTIEPDGLN